MQRRVRTESHALAWCKDPSRGFFTWQKRTFTDKGMRPTHLLMNGGALCVPSEFLPEFYRLYAQDVMEKSMRIFFVTQRDDVFSLFFDYDLCTKRPEARNLDPTDIVNLQRITGAVYDYITSTVGNLPSITFRAYVCGRDPVVKGKEADALSNSIGYHLTFKHIVVSSEAAQVIRLAVLRAFEGVPEEPGQPWVNVIDEHVYVGNGIRMLGSRKMEICKTNKWHEKKQYCPECESRNRKDTGKVYDYVGWIDTSRPEHNNSATTSVFYPMPEGTRTLDQIATQVLQTDIVADPSLARLFISSILSGRRLIFRTTINGDEVAAVDTGVTVDSNHHSTTDGASFHTKRKASASAPVRSDSLSSNDSALAGTPTFRDAPIDTPAVKKLQEFIRGAFPGVATLVISRTLVFVQSCTAVLTCDSFFCGNVGREHNSNHIYFVMYRNGGVVQKCHSLKQNSSGSCHAYKSEPRMFGDLDSVKVIFGDAWKDLSQEAVSHSSQDDSQGGSQKRPCMDLERLSCSAGVVKQPPVRIHPLFKDPNIKQK